MNLLLHKLQTTALWSPKTSQRGNSPSTYCLNNWLPLLFHCQGTKNVNSLFTKVPIDETLRIISKKLDEDETLEERTTLSTGSICQLDWSYVSNVHFSISMADFGSRKMVQLQVHHYPQMYPIFSWSRSNRRLFNWPITNLDFGCAM